MARPANDRMAPRRRANAASARMPKRKISKSARTYD
jgi:hypothetical protein